MTKDGGWLKAAISDDSLVADLLLRLKDSAHMSVTLRPVASLPMSWGLRQPRSKSSPSSSLPTYKKRETRRSPTTPLSWTGGASPSDVYDESSSLPPPQPSDRLRSKISATTETPSTTTSKRSRRKKTFAELKEAESSLLKERTYLKKKLVTLRLTLKEQRSINENLKRIKLDLHVQSGVKSEANSLEAKEENTNTNMNTNNHKGESETASSNIPRTVKTEETLDPDLCSAQEVVSSQEPIFVLPDLNMTPEEESSQLVSLFEEKKARLPRSKLTVLAVE